MTNNFLKKIVVISISILTFSCSSNSNQKNLMQNAMITKYEKESLNSKQKGIIIISVAAKNKDFEKVDNKKASSDFFNTASRYSKNTFLPKISKYEMYWLKEDNSLIDIYQSDWFLISKGKSGRSYKYIAGINSDVSDDQYLVYEVDPGSYNLYNLEIFNSYVLFSGNNFWVSTGDYQDKLASFAIKEGDILYLGDLEIFYKNLNLDRFKHAENIRIEVKDRYQNAKDFLVENHPNLAKNLEKSLITGSILTQK